MSRTLPERTPPKPPREWASEQQRQEWLVKEGRKPIKLNHFLDAISIMRAKVGDLHEYGTELWVSNEIYLELLDLVDTQDIWPIDPMLHPEQTKQDITLYGVPVIVAKHIEGRGCSLSGKGATHYTFKIPHPDTVEIAPRQPSNTPMFTGDYSFDFGLSGWLWKQLMRLVDWLNKLFGATDKPKRKNTDEQMATLSELFEGHEERPSSDVTR